MKIAQAFSTRVDLLPPAYFVAIQRLQDRVAPFPDSLAYAAIEEAFGGVPLGQVFSSVSSSAVAAASLGQVYRGTLRASGMDVAIKVRVRSAFCGVWGLPIASQLKHCRRCCCAPQVRRPGVLESVTLDLHLMRGVAMQLRSVPQVRRRVAGSSGCRAPCLEPTPHQPLRRAQVKSDWVGIIDSWATQFIEEIDYQLEAQNTARMAADLASLPGVVVPDVVEATPSVLVTSWIDGERLSNRRDADVRQLCNTLLTAYLMQLLETGLLHADPHTGNLLVTPDGRVALLDHGLVQVAQSLQMLLAALCVCWRVLSGHSCVRVACRKCHVTTRCRCWSTLPISRLETGTAWQMTSSTWDLLNLWPTGSDW